MSQKRLSELDMMAEAARGLRPYEDWMFAPNEAGEPRIKFIQDMYRDAAGNGGDECPGPGYYRHPDTGVWMHPKTAKAVDAQRAHL